MSLGSCLTKILGIGFKSTLMEPSLNDGEVVVQARRSTKVINMIQKFIHNVSLPFGQGCHMRDASIQIPYRTFIAKDFKDAVAEDQEARTDWDSGRLSWKIYTTKSTHDQAGGRKKKRIRVARKQHNGGRIEALSQWHLNNL
jgi:hypothetical protein